MRRARVLAAMMALTLTGVACGNDEDGGDAAMGGGDVVQAELARVAVDPRRDDGAAAADNALGTDLYRLLVAERQGNLVFSPYSIAVALAMTRNGAAGDTAAEMDAVLHAELAGDLNTGFNALDAALAARNGERSSGEERTGEVRIATANALWPQAGQPFQQAFLDTLAAQYGAGLHTVDYGDPETARGEINDWVADRTEDRIPELVPAGLLDPLTRLVLTNAVYFKAPWREQYAALGDRIFTLPDGTSVAVPTMTGGSGGRYGSGAGWSAAALPYLGDELEMVVVVPDDLGAFEAGLDPRTIETVRSQLDETLLYAQLPLFTFRSQLPLGGTLQALGMPTAFDPDRADFSAMTAEEDLFISAVQHEAFIAVDEQGTEAAASTAVMMRARGAPVGGTLVADRPFLFAVRDVATGAVLFLGRVVDPRTG